MCCVVLRAVVDSVEYEVERSDKPLEIRRYPSMVLATVYGRSDNDAFGILLDYISGNNTPRRKIPMTAPVISSEKIAMTVPVISDGRSFSFVMPSGQDADTIPEPRDTRVKLEAFPARRMAVVRFRGRAREKAVRVRTSELTSYVGGLGLKAKGEPSLMRYNPPFTPGFLRRNELAVEVVQ